MKNIISQSKASEMQSEFALISSTGRQSPKKSRPQRDWNLTSASDRNLSQIYIIQIFIRI